MKKQKQVIIVLIAVLVVSVTLGTLANNSNVHAQEKVRTILKEPTSLQIEKTLSVTGVATNSVEPDLLTVRLGIETERLTAADTMSVNSEMLSKVIEALKAATVFSNN